MKIEYLKNKKYTDPYFLICGSEIKNFKNMLFEINLNFTDIIFYFDSVTYNNSEKRITIKYDSNKNKLILYDLNINDSITINKNISSSFKIFIDFITEKNFIYNNIEYKLNNIKMFFSKNYNTEYFSINNY